MRPGRPERTLTDPPSYPLIHRVLLAKMLAHQRSNMFFLQPRYFSRRLSKPTNAATMRIGPSTNTTTSTPLWKTPSRCLFVSHVANPHGMGLRRPLSTAIHRVFTGYPEISTEMGYPQAFVDYLWIGTVDATRMDAHRALDHLSFRPAPRCSATNHGREHVDQTTFDPISCYEKKDRSNVFFCLT